MPHTPFKGLLSAPWRLGVMASPTVQMGTPGLEEHWGPPFHLFTQCSIQQLLCLCPQVLCPAQ
jgi:hypothetical protein